MEDSTPGSRLFEKLGRVVAVLGLGRPKRTGGKREQGEHLGQKGRRLGAQRCLERAVRPWVCRGRCRLRTRDMSSGLHLEVPGGETLCC